LVAERGHYIAEYEASIADLDSTIVFDEETAKLEMECAETARKAQEYVTQNAKTAQNQDIYKREFGALVAHYDSAKLRLEAVKREKTDQVVRREKNRRFLSLLEQNAKPLIVFDEQLWQAAVDSLVVHTTGDITVMFKSGTQIPVQLP
jgi:hypothetical protein